ncbi:Uncharacterised protein [Vibrio cholerae]|nr:Uncharacterised protein [Vibrio cholerae]CSI26182.1 Uncharacterised protein [Vibrio cholerae]CSI68261.1 Uncharacterised protein [Vibrio cholerae]
MNLAYRITNRFRNSIPHHPCRKCRNDCADHDGDQHFHNQFVGKLRNIG